MLISTSTFLHSRTREIIPTGTMQKSRLQSAGWTKPGELAGRFLARLAGIGEEGMTWRLTHDKPWFENQISTLTIQDRRATLTFRKAVLNRAGEPDLEEIHERRLA